MSAITYRDDFLEPSSSASTADDHLRDFWQDIALGTDGTFFWPGSNSSQGLSDGSTGELFFGTAVMGETSLDPSNFSKPDGTILAYTPLGLAEGARVDQNRGIAFFHASQNSAYLANTNMETGVDPVSPSVGYDKSHWLVQEGTVQLSATPFIRSDSIEFPTPYGSTINNIFVQVSVINPPLLSASHGFVASVHNVTQSGFSSTVSSLGTTPGVAIPTLMWRSEGTVDF